MAEDETDHELDLPLSANITDILVDHFIFEWNLNQGINIITLFLVSPGNTSWTKAVTSDSNYIESLSQSEENNEEFKFMLDCCDIDIIGVEEIVQPHKLSVPKLNKEKRDDIHDKDGIYMKHLNCNGKELQFEVKKHFITIWKAGVQSVNNFPGIVRIKYKIREDGKSFKWTEDQDKKSCGFTIGHWINNRSLFPSQDAPTAMPTWQSIITVPIDFLVLMTGDINGFIYDNHTTKDSKSYYFYSTMPMPTSTLALAIGHWSEITISTSNNSRSTISPCIEHREDCRTNFSMDDIVPCRLFLPQSLLTKKEELEYYLPRCMKAVKHILGLHPFQRLDILIVPACFDSLGMASPGLLFLSQSVLVGDYSMCPRISHELCHSWFGLLIGPKDWTEEWLTEGFCTYLEDIVHTDAMEWDEVTSNEIH